MRKMGPLMADHPLVADGAPNNTCPACRVRFAVGEYVTLLILGPGTDEEGRQRRDEGRPYNALALPIHWDCAAHEG